MKICAIIPFTISFLLFACNQPQKTTSTPAPEVQSKKEVKKGPQSSMEEEIVDDGAKDTVLEPGSSATIKSSDEATLMRLIVSFYSIGEGIDRGEPEKLALFIDSSEKKSGTKVEFSKVHWGREGETDYCFPLIGMKDQLIMDFMSGAKDALKSALHVHFLENQACRKGR